MRWGVHEHLYINRGLGTAAGALAPPRPGDDWFRLQLRFLQGDNYTLYLHAYCGHTFPYVGGRELRLDLVVTCSSFVQWHCCPVNAATTQVRVWCLPYLGFTVEGPVVVPMSVLWAAFVQPPLPRGEWGRQLECLRAALCQAILQRGRWNYAVHEALLAAHPGWVADLLPDVLAYSDCDSCYAKQ